MLLWKNPALVFIKMCLILMFVNVMSSNFRIQTFILIDVQIPKDLIFPSLLQGRNFPTVCYMFTLSVLLISTAQHLLSHGFHGKRASIVCLDYFLLVHAILKTFLKMKLPRLNLIYSYLFLSYFFFLHKISSMPRI